MGMAEPLEPQSDDPFAPKPEQPPAPPAETGRADWLCGPDEGLEAERARTEGADGALPVPRLIRPGGDPSGAAPPPPRVTPKPLSQATGSAVPFAPPAPMASTALPSSAPPPDAPHVDAPQAWTAAASSVPRLRREDRPRAAGIETMRAEFPMDDVDERPRGGAAAAAAAAPVVPEPIAAAPSEFQVAEPVVWWQVVLEAFKTNRIVQLGSAAIVVLLAVLAFMPRGPRATSLRDVRLHADRYDGQLVHVKGRVGEVFSVGGGHAYYLHQGKDTLVVFTRSGAPRVRSRVSLDGRVSTGYLDGEARVAVFQE